MVERNAEARSRVWGLSSGLFIGLLQLIPRSRPAPDQHVCENFRAGVWDNAALGLSVNMKPRLASSAPPVHQFLICGNNLNAHRCISVKKKLQNVSAVEAQLSLYGAIPRYHVTKGNAVDQRQKEGANGREKHRTNLQMLRSVQRLGCSGQWMVWSTAVWR